MKTIKFLSIVSLFGVLLIFSCEPHHHGEVYIINKSTDSLILSFKDRYRDTVIYIPPYHEELVYTFGGLGSGHLYSSVLVEFEEISLVPFNPSKILEKRINNLDDWQVINENRHVFNWKKIICRFVVE